MCAGRRALADGVEVQLTRADHRALPMKSETRLGVLPTSSEFS